MHQLSGSVVEDNFDSIKLHVNNETHFRGIFLENYLENKISFYTASVQSRYRNKAFRGLKRRVSYLSAATMAWRERLRNPDSGILIAASRLRQLALYT